MPEPILSPDDVAPFIAEFIDTLKRYHVALKQTESLRRKHRQLLDAGRSETFAGRVLLAAISINANRLYPLQGATNEFAPLVSEIGKGLGVDVDPFSQLQTSQAACDVPSAIKAAKEIDRIIRAETDLEHIEERPDGVFHRLIRVDGRECPLTGIEEKICHALFIADTADVKTLFRQVWGKSYQKRHDRRMRVALSRLSIKMLKENFPWQFNRRGDVVKKEHV